MYSARLHHQSGIALGPILFIIAVLAILAAAIAAGSGGFTANTANEQAKSNAQVLVNYADQLQAAVQNVMANNSCSDTQLQFQGTNPNAPANGSCNIFDPRGGGLVEMNFSNLNGAFDMTKATNNSNWWGTFSHFRQETSNAVLGVGNQNNGQLLYVIHDLSLGTCIQINNIIKFNSMASYNPPNIYTFHIAGYYPYFQGVYTSGSPADLGFASNSVQQGCIFNASGILDYEYVGVLLAR